MNTTQAKRAFHGTKVSAGRSQGEITDLLRKRGIKTQWTDQGAAVVLRFMWQLDGVELIGRIVIEYPRVPPPPKRGRVLPPAVRGEREINRIFRCLVAWFKGQLAAIDAGLFSLDEAFSPFIEINGGRTTVGRVVPQLAAAGRLALAAPATAADPAARSHA